MRSSKQKSAKGEFILEQDSEHDQAQEKLNKLKEISMKIDSGRKKSLDASSRNSGSPDKRMILTGDDAPFRKSLLGSENGENSIRIEQNDEPEQQQKPQPETIKESNDEEELEEA